MIAMLINQYLLNKVIFKKKKKPPITKFPSMPTQTTFFKSTTTAFFAPGSKIQILVTKEAYIN